MTCSWCGTKIADYGSHFASYAGKPCRLMAVAAQREPTVTNLDGNRTHAQIRRTALRDLKINARRDRLEKPGVATYHRRDRRGRP